MTIYQVGVTREYNDVFYIESDESLEEVRKEAEEIADTFDPPFFDSQVDVDEFSGVMPPIGGLLWRGGPEGQFWEVADLPS